MPLSVEHPWDLEPEAAVRLQQELAGRFVGSPLPRVETICGVAAVFDESEEAVFAAAALLEAATLKPIAETAAQAPAGMAYTSGLLAFTVGPAMLEALGKLPDAADAYLFQGHGRAHPRRCGIATHLGILLDVPSLGCANGLVCGEFEPPGAERGSWSPVVSQGETVGAAVRTQREARPVFVSPGHRMDLESAVRLAVNATDTARMPVPLRRALSLAKMARSTRRLA